MNGDLENNSDRPNTSKSWSLDKVGGNYSAKPSSHSRKLAECLPLSHFLQIKLKKYLSPDEIPIIIQKKFVKVDNKIRTEEKFPVGFMDVISIEKISEFYRVIYNPKGRFHFHRIHEDESKYKLCKVKEIGLLVGSDVSFLTTHDGRSIRNPDPSIGINDTVRVDLITGTIIDYIKFQIGHLCMITAGPNHGVVGNINSSEGNIDGNAVYKVRNSRDQIFVCNSSNAFIIGKTGPWIHLPSQWEY